MRKILDRKLPSTLVTNELIHASGKFRKMRVRSRSQDAHTHLSDVGESAPNIGPYPLLEMHALRICMLALLPFLSRHNSAAPPEDFQVAQFQLFVFSHNPKITGSDTHGDQPNFQHLVVYRQNDEPHCRARNTHVHSQHHDSSKPLPITYTRAPAGGNFTQKNLRLATSSSEGSHVHQHYTIASVVDKTRQTIRKS